MSVRGLYRFSLFLIPFSAISGVGIFGELAMEAAFYTVLMSAALYLPRVVKVRVSSGLLKMFFLLAASIGLSFLLNLDEVFENELKGRSGVNKFVSSIPVLLFGFYVTWLTVWISTKYRDLRSDVITPIIYGFLVTLAVAFIEFGAWFNGAFYSVYDYTSMILRSGKWPLFTPMRLQSVTFEPSIFSLYLGFVLVVTRLMLKGNESKPQRLKKNFITACVVSLMILANARTAFVVLCGLCMIMMAAPWLVSIRDGGRKAIIFFIAPMFVILLAAVFMTLLPYLEVIVSDGDSVSNISRLGSNVAALNIFLSNPLFGSGFGQFAFNAYDSMPNWAWGSYEIESWYNDPDSTWPPVFSLPFRIAAELGVLGLVAWYFPILMMMYKVTKIAREYYKAGYEPVVAKALCVGLVYALLCGVSYDSFRVVGVWIIFGLVSRYLTLSDPERELFAGQRKSKNDS